MGAAVARPRAGRARRSSSGSTATSSGRGCSTRSSTIRSRAPSTGAPGGSSCRRRRWASTAAALAPYRDRIAVIPFGIDVARWDATAAVGARAAAIRAESRGRPLVLFAGRMVPYKGVDVLLRALAGLDAAAVIAGDGHRGAGWMALARELGLADRVRFAGEVPHAELRGALSRVRRLRPAVGHAGRGVRLRAARSDGLRQAGHQHRRAPRRAVGEPATARPA